MSGPYILNSKRPKQETEVCTNSSVRYIWCLLYLVAYFSPPRQAGMPPETGTPRHPAPGNPPSTAPRCLARQREWRGSGQGRRQSRVIMFGDSCHSPLPVSGSIIHYTSVRTPLCRALSAVRCTLSTVRHSPRPCRCLVHYTRHLFSVRPAFLWRVPVPMGGKR